MRVKLRVYADLAEEASKSAGDNYDFHVNPGATVAQLLNEAGINRGNVRIVMINNSQAELGTAVKDGDEISIFPSMGGF